MAKNEFLYWGVSKLLKSYKSRELSPVEVIKTSLKSATECNEKYNFITEYFEETAIKNAKISENCFMGKGHQPRLLEGISLAIKDEFALKGSFRTSGSVIYKKRKDQYTDVYISRLIDGGCIPVFKTTTPEFCLLGTTWSDLHGITTNPWNEKYTPGGSSGGSGVALASGCSTIATGTDIGGSIRIPASACGVFGFKPPYGRNPEVPYMNLDYYSHSGPMARSAEDIILMQALTSGINKQDITSLQKISPFDYNLNLKGLKIAWSNNLCGFDVDDDVLDNLKKSLEIFSTIGADVEEVHLDLSDNILEATEIYLNSLWGTFLSDGVKGQEHKLCAYTKKYLDHSKERKLSDLIYSNRVAWDAYSKFGPMIDKYDIFICPTNAVTGIPANHGYPNLMYEFNGKIKQTKEDGDEKMWLTTPFNMMSRLPVMSAPTGFASNGVPTGMQIVGKAYDDNTVFKTTLAYEKMIPWLFDVNNRPSL
jgi:Asp-tRNA(Asn)/Glu-tRNA(Gln) amidotransferase A subunit family amidase